MKNSANRCEEAINSILNYNVLAKYAFNLRKRYPEIKRLTPVDLIRTDADKVKLQRQWARYSTASSKLSEFGHTEGEDVPSYEGIFSYGISKSASKHLIQQTSTNKSNVKSFVQWDCLNGDIPDVIDDFAPVNADDPYLFQDDSADSGQSTDSADTFNPSKKKRNRGNHRNKANKHRNQKRRRAEDGCDRITKMLRLDANFKNTRIPKAVLPEDLTKEYNQIMQTWQTNVNNQVDMTLQVAGLELNNSQLSSLFPGKQLETETARAIFSLIENEIHKRAKNNPATNVRFLDFNIYQMTKVNMKLAVDRAFPREMGALKHKYQKLIMPIRKTLGKAGHYALIAVDLESSTIRYCDSLMAHYTLADEEKDFKLIKKFLKEVYPFKTEWTFTRQKSISQNDGFSCGYHMTLHSILQANGIPYDEASFDNQSVASLGKLMAISVYHDKWIRTVDTLHEVRREKVRREKKIITPIVLPPLPNLQGPNPPCS